jgi:hypothetical protein
MPDRYPRLDPLYRLPDRTALNQVRQSLGDSGARKGKTMKRSIFLLIVLALLLPSFVYAANLSVEELELMNQKELCAKVEDYQFIEKNVPENQPGYDEWPLRTKLKVAEYHLSSLITVHSNAKRIYLVARKKNGGTYSCLGAEKICSKG